MYNIKQSWLLLLIVSSAVCCLLTQNTFAASTTPAVGVAIWVKGNVTAVLPDQAKRILKRRSAIFNHDVITTDKGATGEVALSDGTLLSLRENTQIRLDDYRYSQSSPPSEHQSIMTLIKGGFRTVTGTIPKENVDNYKVNAPVATIGVRGTDYSAVMNASNALILKLSKGRIVVSNDQGTIEMNDTNQAYAVVSNAQSAPAFLTQLPPEFGTDVIIQPIPESWQAAFRPASTQNVDSFCIN